MKQTKAVSACTSATRLVCVEGNIGSGKTSFLQQIRRFAPADGTPVTIFQEPIGEWRNLYGQNLLDLLYRDPHRWSFSFNFHMMLCRLKSHSCDSEAADCVKLMERSFHSTFQIFVRNSFNLGDMTAEEFTTLKCHYDLYTKPDALLKGHSQLRSHVDLFVYMRVSPETALKRVQARGRPEEVGIGLEFLSRLHDLHEEYFLPSTDGCTRDGVPVMVIENDDALTHQVWKNESERLFSILR